MNSKWTPVKDIFAAALEIEPSSRERFSGKRAQPKQICTQKSRIFSQPTLLPVILFNNLPSSMSA
jgi:hypothetical protein